MASSDSIAREITRVSGIEISPLDVHTHGDSGYSVQNLLGRKVALDVASAIMTAFATDPEAGLPDIAVRPRCDDSYYVRVIAD